MRRHARRSYRTEPTPKELGLWRDLALQAQVVAGSPAMAAGVMAKARGRVRGKPMPKALYYVGSPLHLLCGLTERWPTLDVAEREAQAADLADLAGRVIAVLDGGGGGERRSRADVDG